MYEIVNCTNDHAGGGIKVEVTWDGEDIGSLAEYELRRYLHGESDYTVVKTGSISTSDDLNYSYYDLEGIAGKSYTYEACVFNGNHILMGSDEQTIRCEFMGIMLSDAFGSWYSAFGTSENAFSMNAQKNKAVSYIATLRGRYPHRVSNAQANYWSGTCTALWLPMGVVCGNESIKEADRYRLEFMEWLTSDTEKLLKTGDGKAMMVSIDGTPRETYSGLAGMTVVSFDWTQTGDEITASGT